MYSFLYTILQIKIFITVLEILNINKFKIVQLIQKINTKEQKCKQVNFHILLLVNITKVTKILI
jgi:hypothetical protein